MPKQLGIYLVLTYNIQNTYHILCSQRYEYDHIFVSLKSKCNLQLMASSSLIATVFIVIISISVTFSDAFLGCAHTSMKALASLAFAVADLVEFGRANLYTAKHVILEPRQD